MSFHAAVQESPHTPVERKQWSSALRFLFRFAFVYLVLYSFIPLGVASIAQLHNRFLFLMSERFWSALSLWTAKSVFHLSNFDPSFWGSDSVLGWTHVALLLMIAAVASVLWSVIDRNRREYVTLHEWLRLFVRIALALTMVDYGSQKIWPNQMPLVRPHQLLGELGSYTPGQLLWVFIGASRSYELFTGCVELLAGALLFVPNLTTIGALVATVAMTNVFALNVCYDVQVKLFSLHLLVMSVFLLIPDLRRLAGLFLFNRPTAPAARVPLFQRLTVLAFIFQIVIGSGAILNALLFQHSITARMNVSDTSPVPFYGIWDVEEFSLDSVAHPPLTTDNLRWHRVCFDSYNSASIQKMNGAIIGARLRSDAPHGTLMLDYAGDTRPELKEFVGEKWRAEFKLETPSPDSILMQGQYDGHAIAVKLRRSQLHFILQPHETHWVLREHPVFYY